MPTRALAQSEQFILRFCQAYCQRAQPKGLDGPPTLLAIDAREDPYLVRREDDYGAFYTCDKSPLSVELLNKRQEYIDDLKAEVEDIFNMLLPDFSSRAVMTSTPGTSEGSEIGKGQIITTPQSEPLEASKSIGTAAAA